MLTNHKEIREWLDAHGLAHCTINIHGEVDCSVAVGLLNAPGASVPPFKFGTVLGDFKCGMTSLESIDWLPTYIGRNFDCSATNIKSFAGFDKHVKYIGGSFMGSRQVATHLLGLFFIKGITRFVFDHPINIIMNKYVGTGDILSAQDELIDAGFIDQARL
jgi:hypothetical protein